MKKFGGYSSTNFLRDFGRESYFMTDNPVGHINRTGESLRFDFIENYPKKNCGNTKLIQNY